MSNVIRLAQAQVAQANAAARKHTREEAQRKPALDEGELLWVGEYKNKDMKAYKMTRGDKTPMSDSEQKFFARTPYERGFTEFLYEGQMKVHDSKAVAKDPRAATREGQGLMWYPNGSMYEGQWKNDSRHGHGYFSANTGYKYTGGWDSDQPGGRGFESVPAGIAYDGSMSNGNPNGSGVLLFNANQSQYRYEGEFSNGHRHGKGVIFYDNGDTFAGTFDQGKRHGRGITTTSVRGKELQYATEWDQDVLVKHAETIPSVRRVKKPKPTLSFSTQGHLVAADLTKWSVKDDVTELTLEHFMKIKLGFEGLDVHGTGSLSTVELTSVWGTGSTAMLQKLDTDGNGTVELDEIFAAWYPNVPSHNILRFMQQNINPRVLLRLRGMLNQVKDERNCGYLQLCGIYDMDDAEDDPPLHLKNLEHNDYKIGDEKFTAANYVAAKQLFDPPHFLEVLEVWYPNIPHATLARYDNIEIDPNELALIKKDFFRLSRNNMQLLIEEFEEAREQFQLRIAKAHEEEEMRRVEEANNSAGASMFGVGGGTSLKSLSTNQQGAGEAKKSKGGDDDDDTTSVSASNAASPPREDGTGEDDKAIEKEMVPGFFKGEPEWAIGNSIRLSVPLLHDIDKFETRLHGTVTLQQLLRYCYPNARCRQMQEILGTKKKVGLPPSGGAVCTCPICTIA